MIRRGADFPFETRVIRIWQAENAAAAERDLHDELAPGLPIGEWFDLRQFPPEQAQPAGQGDSVSLRDLARNEKAADSLLEDMQLVGAEPQAAAPSVRRPAGRRRPPVMRWVALLALVVLAAAVAGERSIDIQSVINAILTPSTPGASSRAVAQPTSKPVGTALPSATPTMRIRLSQRRSSWPRNRDNPSLQLVQMPQAENYQYRFSVNDSGFSAWQTVDRFSAKLAGLSPGDRVIFRLRAQRDGVYSRIAQVSDQTLLAPTATSIPPTATATDPPPTATDAPPTATSIPPTATATDAPPTATSIPPTATATDAPPTATSIRRPRLRFRRPPRTAPRSAMSSIPRAIRMPMSAPARERPVTSWRNTRPGLKSRCWARSAGEMVYGIDIWYEINWKTAAPISTASCRAGGVIADMRHANPSLYSLRPLQLSFTVQTEGSTQFHHRARETVSRYMPVIDCLASSVSRR